MNSFVLAKYRHNRVSSPVTRVIKFKRKHKEKAKVLIKKR